MNAIVADNPVRLYTVLQVAIGKFGAPLNKLPEADRQQAEQIANRQYELQTRVLSSERATAVVITGASVDQALESVISRYPDRDAFLDELEGNHLDIPVFKEAVERELRVEAVMDLVANEARQVDETDARIYYYLHPEKFQKPETREAAHILMTVNPDFPENTQERVVKHLGTVAARLQKKPHRFAEQAMKNSECPTAMDGGQLGNLKKGILFPTLDAALFAMKEGEISEPIESPMGFHILRCSKIHSEGLVPIQQALPTILEKLNERNRKDHQKAWLKTLMNQ